MSLIARIFQKKQEEDYETILSTLAQDIQKRHVKLSEIRLRERRATLLVTLYTLAGWVAYVSMWYMGFLPNQYEVRRGGRIGKAITGAPVVVGPIVILFIRRIIQIWYKRKGDAEEKTLQALMKQQKLKVAEIKKKTNFESTRDLIQRYESPTTPVHLRPLSMPSQPITPQRQVMHLNANSIQTPNPSQPQISPSPLVPHSSMSPRKQWFDKLADAVLGDDDHTPSASTSRYALICEKCFAHNGLVKEILWADTQYLCPKCHHFNPSYNAKRARGRSPSASPQPSSQQPSPTPSEAPRREGHQRRTPPAEETSLMEVDGS